MLKHHTKDYSLFVLLQVIAAVSCSQFTGLTEKTFLKLNSKLADKLRYMTTTPK